MMGKVKVVTKFKVPGLDKVQKSLDRIEDLLRQQIAATQEQNERVSDMAISLEALTAEVNENSDVVASAERVLDGLVQQLQEASGNQAEIDAITAQIGEQKTRLAQAIANVGPHVEHHDDGTPDGG